MAKIKMSRTERLLKYLKAGHSVTGAIAFRKFHLYRLSEYVRRFRAKGYPIVTTMVTAGGITFASYRLNSNKK